MTIRYSKPSRDVASEFDGLVRQEAGLQETVRRLNGLLARCPPRAACLMCGEPLSGAARLEHRGLPFALCSVCGHLQSLNMPDSAFDRATDEALGYKGIYAGYDPDSYRSRMTRVYQPKAAWAVDVLKDRAPGTLRWADIGCGTGGFLAALREAGCARVRGFERDPHNIRVAMEALGPDIVTDHGGSVADAVAGAEADVYSAFFVLEHVETPRDVARALKSRPPGTVFAFSVPVFGFATVFESAEPDHYPRNLDGMMHTQLYTDQSIAWFLREAGMSPLSEWIFGQDAMDFARFLAFRLKDRYPPALYGRVMEIVGGLVDPLQSAIDRAAFADARHVLAVRKD